MEPLVYLWADESCLGNQFMDRASPGGAAGLVEHWDGSSWFRRDYWLSEPETTNNRMAIRSATDGLRLLRRPCRVIFTSDSQYLIRGMREWVQQWVRRGWRRKEGPVENEALWKELVEAARRHRVDWRWVRGHAGHPHNEYANFLATRAARQQTSSDGLLESGFAEWLATERRESERYAEFDETAPPRTERFDPASPA